MFPILIIVVVGSMEVLLRNLASSTVWAWEFNGQLLALYIAMGGGYTLLADQHVRMDLFYANFSPRVKASLDIILSCLFFVFVGVILWYFAGLAWNSILLHEHDSMSTWRPPLYPIKALIFIGIANVLLAGVAKLLRDVSILMTGKGNTP